MTTPDPNPPAQKKLTKFCCCSDTRLRHNMGHAYDCPDNPDNKPKPVKAPPPAQEAMERGPYKLERDGTNYYGRIVGPNVPTKFSPQLLAALKASEEVLTEVLKRTATVNSYTPDAVGICQAVAQIVSAALNEGSAK